ncbi:hypothetical protein DICPUDRAFT_55299 [Dictyostelium purpureum]|uniref:Counting factor associated protein D n=1 Tax=Dictyostelium purpureum TaxID=5786 RepID=F0ZLG1_DICPU|nr:uncharacterized protein DICPUDRAFT_55299 [Dictyostelium purpureum]EGC35214.1 hypothetical protein DICPUDRAFT_55299 [Dictyostelium purpureum]|eukprot:XP_003288252.1 hypothetical protein DICPUDRAFT_55299 [Dictyostelium purpureum]
MIRSILLLAFVTLSCVLAVPQLPTDQQYYMKGTFSIPYFNITEPIELIYDATNNRQYISYYDGMDITINFFNQDISYTISPVKYEMTCVSTQGNGTLVNVLPTEPSQWAYNGTSTVNGVSVYSYFQKITQYGRTGYYTFYVDANGTPVQFYMNGVDYVFGSHPDIYVLDFTTYSTDLSQYESLFQLPALCNNAEEAPLQEGQLSGAFESLGDSLKVKESDLQEKFVAFKSEYEKSYENKEEHDMRFKNYKVAHNKIVSHNAKNLSYKLGFNHYADLSDHEFNTLIKPKVARPSNNGAHSVHDDEDIYTIPQSVDWRNQKCVTPVKDQGVCGSCWTFGSTGSLEGTNCVTNGYLVSLSEQQLVDCAYLMGSQGCNGGFAASAFQYIMDAGGIATESDYQYLMQNALCKDKSTTFSGVGVSSYVNVTAGSINALLNAVATQGPVAIAIDASVDDFRYYQSGIYSNPSCKNGPDDLDHEVLAIGYGTLNGVDYWLVKNSWSTNWGMEGYFMLERANNLCGPASQATYPLPTTSK